MSLEQAILRLPVAAPELREVVIAPTVVAAGDHPAVLVMGMHLASMGISVTLLHPFEDMETLLSPVEGLIEVDEQVAKRYRSLLEEASKNQNISVLNGAEILDVSGRWGDFSVSVRVGETPSTLKASGLALAYRGNSVSDTISHDDVIDFREFLSRLEIHKGLFKGMREPLGKIAFVLDASRRDEKWASVTALKVGSYLKRNFGTQVYILCREFKVSVDAVEQEYRHARELGILIFKYKNLPAIEGTKGHLRLMFNDDAAVSEKAPLEVVLEDLDAVVVQEGITLREEQIGLLQRLKIPTEGGFVGPNNPQFIGRTPKRGVVVAGDMWYPEYLLDSYATAIAAAEELYQWVGKGTYKIDARRVAEVDPSKCATCLTCFRICPHDSIRIERYGERNVYITPGEKDGPTWEAARIVVETCDGCGLCASECPAKAIQLVYYPDMEIIGFLERTL